ncbi:MAG: hypothetical protein HKN28_08690 [Alphaproteobacteria bacterium]|nr:hypothetical protein [Alphaproteobacteria bacterium]
MPWENVSDEEAIEVKYFGVRGCLKFFYILSVLGFASSVYNLISPDPFLVELYDGNLGLLQTIYLISIALQLPFLVLTPIGHPLMPSLSIICSWVYTIFILTFAFEQDAATEVMIAEGVSPEIVAGFNTGIAILIIGTTVLWTWYLLCSKRVNVTYRNRVRDWELVLRAR